MLREFRRARGYSLRSFALASHHSQSLIGQWEIGRKVPPPDIVDGLDHLLTAEAEELDVLALRGLHILALSTFHDPSYVHIAV